MILSDELFDNDSDSSKAKDGQQIDAPNQNPTNTMPSGKNEELEKQRDYQQDQSNNKASDDASAHRNVGANGYTQNSEQKDQLSNLHIGGGEGEPQGGNDHSNGPGQGPGFAAEGSYELGPGILMHEQELGSDAADGDPEVRT
jgi:hypothetical protein